MQLRKCVSILIVAIICFSSTTGFAAAGKPSKSTEVTPQQRYDKIWKQVEDSFLFRDRLKDWASWQHRFDGLLKTDRDADDAIQVALASLNDQYTELFSIVYLPEGSELPSIVDSFVRNDGIGVVRIKSFLSPDAGAQVYQALWKVRDAKAIVIDLRGNPGGWVNQGELVFEELVDSGKFARFDTYSAGKPVTVTYRMGTAKWTLEQNGKPNPHRRMYTNLTGNKPMIVLVDGHTASTAEFLLQALQYNGRAVSVGTRTFGKGIAQLVFNEPHNYELKVTYAYAYSPSGNCVHGKGLKPTYEVQPEAKTDVSMRKAVEIIEARLATERQLPEVTAMAK